MQKYNRRGPRLCSDRVARVAQSPPKRVAKAKEWPGLKSKSDPHPSQGFWFSIDRPGLNLNNEKV